MSEQGYNRTLALLREMAANIDHVTASDGGGVMVILSLRGNEVDVFDDVGVLHYVSSVRFADGRKLSFDETIKGDVGFPTKGLSKEEFQVLQAKMLESH